eukprot:3851130-Rhodomonas_salina.1
MDPDLQSPLFDWRDRERHREARYREGQRGTERQRRDGCGVEQIGRKKMLDRRALVMEEEAARKARKDAAYREAHGEA